MFGDMWDSGEVRLDVVVDGGILMFLVFNNLEFVFVILNWWIVVSL